MTSIDLSPLYSQLANPTAELLLSGLALAAGAWGAYAITRWLQPRIGKARAAELEAKLNALLAEGVAEGMAYLETLEAKHSKAEVNGALSAWAAQFAIDKAPGLINKTGLSPEALAQKALAHIPTPTEQLAQPIPAENVTVLPLPPVPGGPGA